MKLYVQFIVLLFPGPVNTDPSKKIPHLSYLGGQESDRIFGLVQENSARYRAQAEIVYHFQ